VSAFAASTRESHFVEGLSGIILVRVGLELWTDEGFDFLNGGGFTFAERHFTTLSLGADSSAYIYYS